jgi:hypothetical protein
MSTVRLQVAPRVTPDDPRGSRAAAALALALGRLPGRVSALFRRPPPPRARSAEEEAREVRELALQYRRSDPGFAADLMAAADRHERLYG